MDSDDLSCSECKSPSETGDGGKEAVHYGVKKLSASQWSKLNQLYWSISAIVAGGHSKY